MGRYLITTGTVTYAIKGRELLRRHGYKVGMERITSGTEGVGCGYSLVVSGDIKKAEALLRDGGVKILKITEKTP